jgi:competence protein ComEC
MRIRRNFLNLLLCICLSIALVGCSSQQNAIHNNSATNNIASTITNNNASNNNTSKPSSEASEQSTASEKTESSTDNSISDLEVHFLDVGQGDCIFLTCDNQSMLIDAGDNTKGSTVAAYLKNQGIKTLEIVVGSHNDADHIGGLDVVLYQFDCKNVILSKFAKDSKTYDDVIQTCKNKNYKIQYPERGTEYTLGDAKVTILSDPNYDADSANNSSVSLLVTHQNNTFLFTGDSEEDAESELLKLNDFSTIDVDVLKVGHHGSKSSTSEEFLSAVSPFYAVISCGEDNSYKHPHSATLNALRGAYVTMFRTDKQGTIVATSDGDSIAWNTPKSEDWTPGE